MTNHDVEGRPQGSLGGRAAHIECHKYMLDRDTLLALCLSRSGRDSWSVRMSSASSDNITPSTEGERLLKRASWGFYVVQLGQHLAEWR